MTRPQLIQRFSESALIRQGLRFAAVGFVATGAHYAVLVTLVEAGGVQPVAATTCGYFIGIVVSYALNRRFTFAARGGAGRFAKYVTLYVVGAFLNGAVMGGFMSFGAPYLLAQVGATGLVVVWNFAGARYLVFRD
jgi:putative flippase GtrA